MNTFSKKKNPYTQMQMRLALFEEIAKIIAENKAGAEPPIQHLKGKRTAIVRLALQRLREKYEKNEGTEQK